MSLKLARELEPETETKTFNDDFPALEEKIYKAIELLNRRAKARPPRSATPIACASNWRRAKKNSTCCAVR